MPIKAIDSKINNHNPVKIEPKKINNATKKTSNLKPSAPDVNKKPIPVAAKAVKKIIQKNINVERPNPREIEAQKKKAIIERNDLQHVRFELAKKLNDIDQVDDIVHAYAEMVKPNIPNPEDQKGFEEWMIGISYFLGSPFYDHQLFFKHMNKNPFFSVDQPFKKAFNDFTKKIQSQARPIHRALNTAKKVKNIAILYPGSGGGGHKAPAIAMARSLEAKGYKVKLLDIDDFERPYDPKIGGLTRGEIFTKVYQQEGNAEKAIKMWNEGNEKQPLKDRCYMRDLSNTLKNAYIDQLFVVAHHQPEHTALAYKLGVPTTFVHTDNEFNYNLQDVALNQQELEKPLVSFTALSDQSDFHHFVLEKEGKHHYNELPKKVRSQNVRMNFPVRENFKKVTKSEKTDIRRSLNIDPNATVVKIAMGANGIPNDIKMIMHKIKEEAFYSNKPLHVLVVCGSNKALKDELDAQNHNTGKATFQILGFLNEKEMSDFDKASDVWVTKPGGSTSAEALAMRKQMLYLPNHHHVWELTNARRLEKENLAEELKPWESIMAQINKRAAIGEDVEYQQKAEESWTDQLANIVNRKAKPILNVA